jgi:hypothetical protein
MRKNRNYWTKEKCFEEALKYDTRTKFCRRSCTAYEILRKNNWLDDACKHMKIKYEIKFKWSFEKCHLLALNYKHRKEFQKENKNAYYSAMYNGWLDEICQHMTYKKLPNGYWHNFENCKKEALKYSTKTEFVKGSQHVYHIALKNNWLDDICKHMKPIGDRFNKCIYSYEFPDNHVYVGLTCNIDIRQKSRNKNLSDAVTKHTINTGLHPIRKQLTDYIFVDDAIRLEGEFLSKYLNDGWIGLNKRKTGGIGSRKRFSISK